MIVKKTGTYLHILYIYIIQNYTSVIHLCDYLYHLNNYI